MNESSKLRALRTHVLTYLLAHVSRCLVRLQAHIPTCFPCLRAHVPKYLAWLHAHLPTCLACSRAYMLRVLGGHVTTCLTCSSANVHCVLTCSHANVASVLQCSRANVPYVLTCKTCITSNNKNKFSMTCFPQIFGTFSLPFSCKIRLYMKIIRRNGELEFILRIQQYISALLVPAEFLPRLFILLTKILFDVNEKTKYKVPGRCTVKPPK